MYEDATDISYGMISYHRSYVITGTITHVNHNKIGYHKSKLLIIIYYTFLLRIFTHFCLGMSTFLCSCIDDFNISNEMTVFWKSYPRFNVQFIEFSFCYH